MKKHVVAMVLVGGRGSRLKNITKYTAKPAVSFGGKYKLIDFVLSNVANSGIDTVGLVTQYEPHELMKYIGRGSTWDLDVNDGGITFLTPYTSINGDAWQKGTAHAIKQHFRFIDQYSPEHVVILSGDHIYKMDYQKMIDEHVSKKADVSIASFRVKGNASRFGILEVDKSGKVVGFEEKPEFPKSKIASMGVYVFKKEVLRTLLNAEKQSSNDFGKNIIPFAIKSALHIHSYHFDGYFKDVGTIQALFSANMDLIDKPHFLKLHEYKDWPIYTKSSNLPPHHVQGESVVSNSLISDGCMINGMINHSIISSGVFVDEGVSIKKSIIYSGTRIKRNSRVENAIVLENTLIPENTILEFKKVTVVDNELLWKLGDHNE